MKKLIIFCFVSVIVALLLVCTAVTAASAESKQLISKEEADARSRDRKAAYNALTDAQKTEARDNYFADKNTPTTISLGAPAVYSDGKIKIDNYTGPINAYNKESGVTSQFTATITNTWLEVTSDVIVIAERQADWFTTGTTNASLTIDTSAIKYGTPALTEGARVLILETDGTIHGYIAGANTTENSLHLGAPMQVCRGIKKGHLKYDIGPSFPLPPIGVQWETGSFQTSLIGQTLYLHFDVDIDLDWVIVGIITLDVNRNTIEFKYPDNEVKLWGTVPSGYYIPLFAASKEIVGPFEIGADINLNLEGGGYGTTKYNTDLEEGVKTSLLFIDGYITINSFDWISKTDFIDIEETDQDGEFYLEYAEGVSFTLLGAAGIGADYGGGVVIEGEKSVNHEYPGDKEKKKLWHACADDECVNGNAHMRLGPLAVNALFLGNYYPLESTGKKDFDPFKYYYSSKTFNDHDYNNLCPHVGYRLNVTAQNQGKEPLKGVNVSYKPVPEHYEDGASGKTDAAGETVLYPKEGNYYVTASITSDVDPSITVTEERFFKKTTDVQDMTLTLQIPTKHIWFRNPSTGGTTDWPEDITYMPFYSEHVRLPSNVPQMSGWYFMGWNDKEDGTGKSYLPGQTITAKDDVTLWAKWQKAENSWVIIYEANGASSAPDPQIVPNGVGAYLSRETPDAPTLIFKGWTTDLSKPEPEYQPGDYLAYDSNKRVVVLHAVWQMSPVRRPVYVSYDANGLQGASLPPNFWLIHAGWAQVGYAVAPLGGPRAFLGWSEKPNAVRPEYKAGKAYYFDQDTTLYAVWGVQYKVTYGAGSVWIKGSGKTQRFIANGDVKDFRELRIDRMPITDGVKISSGSTIADISPKVMEKLSNGTHTVTFIYTDGTASAKFTVQPKYPPTGDANHPALWLILVVSGIAGIALVGKRAFTTRRKKQ